jgi:ribosomal protein L37E
MGDEIVHKKCSRCGRPSWDSEVGQYLELCEVDGKMCDANGGTYGDD